MFNFYTKKCNKIKNKIFKQKLNNEQRKIKKKKKRQASSVK